MTAHIDYNVCVLCGNDSESGEFVQAQVELRARWRWNEDEETGNWWSAATPKQPRQTFEERIQAVPSVFAHDVARTQNEGAETILCVDVYLLASVRKRPPGVVWARIQLSGWRRLPRHQRSPKKTALSRIRQSDNDIGM